MPFVKGQSGNPSGKRKDTKTAEMRKLIETHVPDIIQKVIDAAKLGDMVAAKICLERVLPNLKPQSKPEPVAVDLSGTPVEQARAILQGVSAGEIAADDAAQLLNGIASSMKILELTELAARLDALEAAQN
jgi:hypothetical protein